jgi:hypothetical protein
MDVSLNTIKFYLLSCFTDFSNYNYMFRPFLMTIYNLMMAIKKGRNM